MSGRSTHGLPMMLDGWNSTRGPESRIHTPGLGGRWLEQLENSWLVRYRGRVPAFSPIR